MPDFDESTHTLEPLPDLNPEHELPSSIEPKTELPQPEESIQDQPKSEPSQIQTPIWDNNPYGLDPVRTLLTWRASSRPFRKRDRSFYTTVAVLMILVSLIVFLAGEKILVGAIFALGFLVYVLAFIPPEEINYKISTQGITTGDHFYHWQELDSFWFSKKDNHTLLHVLTQIRFPGVLMVILGDEISEDEVRTVCARYLPFHEIAPKSMIEKWSESLQKHFPLENPHK